MEGACVSVDPCRSIECADGEACSGGRCWPDDGDHDGDGFSASTDCDDADPTVHPGAEEVCNGVDDDCNAFVDETIGGGACAPAESTGACAHGTMRCRGTSGLVCVPNAVARAETCDGVDEDCDGEVDEGFAGEPCAVSGAAGPCASGRRACRDGVFVCEQTVTATAEVCDGVDNDCDGAVDDDACGDGRLCAVLSGRATCVLACGDGLTRCGDACRDVSSDPESCGGCGIRCAAGERCESGACVPACSADRVLCGTICVDTSSDRSHCGACGVACGMGEECCGGVCVDTAGNAEQCGGCCVRCGGSPGCDGACRDVGWDEAHCGSCFAACAPDEECRSGSCLCPPDTARHMDRCVPLCATGLSCSTGPAVGADECIQPGSGARLFCCPLGDELVDGSCTSS